MAAHKPRDGKLVHAGPAVRMLARELGVDLELVKPTGPKERVLKEDVHNYVKQVMAGQAKAPAGAPPRAVRASRRCRTSTSASSAKSRRSRWVA